MAAEGAHIRGRSVVRWRWRHTQSLTAVWFTGAHIRAGELKAQIRRSRGFGHVHRKGASDLVVIDEQTKQGEKATGGSCGCSSSTRANEGWDSCAEYEDSSMVARNSVLIVKRVPSAGRGPRESKSAVCRICSTPGHLAVHCPHAGYVKRAPQPVREGAFEAVTQDQYASPSWSNPALQA